MEIFPGVHRIEVYFQNRYLFQHILVGEDNLLFIDSGVVTTPVEELWPYVEEKELIIKQNLFLLVTHNDADHCGGNANLRRLFPQLTIMAHQLDSEDMEDPNRTLKNRYNEMAHVGVFNSQERNQQSLKNLGEKCRVDVGLTGNEVFHLDSDWNVRLLHTPGHTKGHMIVHDPKHRIAIISDAILGRGVPSKDGELALCPTNRYIDKYLETIKQIEELDVDYLLASHYSLISGKKNIRKFIADSREFVASVESYILGSVEKKDSVSLKELIDNVGKRLGNWPKEQNFHLFYSLQGGLEELERKGILVHVENNQEIIWIKKNRRCEKK